MSLYSSLDEAIDKVIGTDLVLGESGDDKSGRTLVSIQCTLCREQRDVPWHRLNAGRPKRCSCKLSTSERAKIGTIVDTDKVVDYKPIGNRIGFVVECLECGNRRTIPKYDLGKEAYKCDCKKTGFDYTQRYRHLIGTHDDYFNFDILDVCRYDEDVYASSSEKGIKLIVRCCDCDRLFSITANRYFNKDFKNVKLCVCKDNSQLQNSYTVEEADKIIQDKYSFMIGKTSGFLTVSGVGLYDNKVSVLCNCTCGNEIILSLSKFNSARYLSCGCLSSSFGEKVISDYLLELGISFNREVTFDDLISIKGYKLRYDFGIKASNRLVLIEYNGRQHYDSSCFQFLDSDENEFDYRHSCDLLKENYAKEHNIPLLIIHYTSNVQDIRNQLLSFLKDNSIIKS